MEVRTPTTAKLLLTIPEAAARVSLSPRTLYNLFRKKELKCVHVGRSCRIDAAELEAFVGRLAKAAETA